MRLANATSEYRITVSLDNDAFEEDARAELTRCIMQALDSGDPDTPYEGPIWDGNGNVVGKAEVSYATR